LVVQDNTECKVCPITTQDLMRTVVPFPAHSSSQSKGKLWFTSRYRISAASVSNKLSTVCLWLVGPSQYEAANRPARCSTCKALSALKKAKRPYCSSASDTSNSTCAACYMYGSMHMRQARMTCPDGRPGCGRP